MSVPEGPTTLKISESPDLADFSFVPIPSGSVRSTTLPRNASFTPLVNDGRAINRLLEQIIYRSGKTAGGVAKELGTSPNNVNQYLAGRRVPGLVLFLRICAICNTQVMLDLPSAK